MKWLLSVMLAVLVMPGVADAHDDPVVTVRVMCDGFNILDQDQVLGEISDSAIVHFDGTIQGSREIHAWVQEQMDDDLRIQIDTIGTPRQLPDGYTLQWTASFSRQDWRQQGVQSRQATNTVVIHNGRITEWTATLDSMGAVQNSVSSATMESSSGSRDPGSSASVPLSTESVGMPVIAGVPISLWLAGVVAIVGAAVVGRGALHR